MQWLQDPNQSNVDNLNNERREDSRHFRNKWKEYLKEKFDELETNSKIKNIRFLYRGKNDFKKGYQPITNLVKDEKGDLVTGFHSILASWKNHFSQFFNAHGVSCEIHTAEPLVVELSAFKVVMAIEKLKRHKSPSIDRIPAELFEAGGRTFRSEIHKLINSIWTKDELPKVWKESFIVPIYKKGDETDCSNYRDF